MRSSVTPESMRSDSESCSWVVVQGWIARVLESPTLERRLVVEGQGRGKEGKKLGTNLARLEMSLKPSTTSLPAAAPPLTPNDKTPP